MSDTLPRSIVRRARDLIEKPEGWTIHGYALDAEGENVSTYCEKAAAFCAAGAIMRAAYDLGCSKKDVMNYARKLGVQIADPIEGINDPLELLQSFNDSSQHHEVVAAFDRYLARQNA